MLPPIGDAEAFDDLQVLWLVFKVTGRLNSACRNRLGARQSGAS